MAFLTGWLFFDRFRALVTFVVILIGVVLLGMQYLYPRPVKMDQETLDSLKESTAQIRRTAQSTELLVQDNILFKATLQGQLDSQAKLREKNYARIFEQFDVQNLPSSFGSTPGGIDYGLQQQSNDLRGENLPRGPDVPGRVQQLRDTIDNIPKTTDGSTTGVSGGDSGPTEKQSIGPGRVPGK